jgi:hypothetical protein
MLSTMDVVTTIADRANIWRAQRARPSAESEQRLAEWAAAEIERRRQRQIHQRVEAALAVLDAIPRYKTSRSPEVVEALCAELPALAERLTETELREYAADTIERAHLAKGGLSSRWARLSLDR